MADPADDGVGGHAVHRVFIGMGEVAGYFGALQEGFRSLGVRADFCQLRRHAFRYASPGSRMLLQRALDYLGGLRPRHGRLRPLLVAAVRAAQSLCLAAVLVRSAVLCDLFIFAGRTTFFRGADLPLLRMLGKKVVCVFLGSDVRPAYLNGRNLPATPGTVRRCIRQVRRQRRSIRWIERWATAVVSHAPCSQLLERPAVSFLAVGIPARDIAAGPPSPARSGPVRVLHSPSLPACKGTSEIRRMVEELAARGLLIDYREVVNVPHDRVLDEIRGCDLVVDQLYSDTPMAAFAAEAAALGRAAVVGGYFDAGDLLVAAQDVPPSVCARPGGVRTVLEELASRPDRCQALGARAQAFVRERWRADRVASRFLRIAEGRAPAGWWFDPRDVRYAHGWGMNDEDGKRFLGLFVAAGGVSALGLSGKPALRRVLEGRLP